jgi:hypothetical protein
VGGATKQRVRREGQNVAGYSGTPLAHKLGIKRGSRVDLVEAPAGFGAQLEPLPPDVDLSSDHTVPADVIVLFVEDAASLRNALETAMRVLPADGGLWIAWRKGGGRVAGALTESAVRAAGLAVGLVDNKICAIDESWSGLRFVVRTADRAGWPVR